MTTEQLKAVREFIIDNIVTNPDIMFSDDIRGNNDTDIDLIEIIASLYELLHKEVTGESYDYMFHWANKLGSWVESNSFNFIYKED